MGLLQVGAEFQLGEWTVDVRARTLTCGARVRRISPKAIGVLQVLAGADGAVVVRADLIDAVWPEVVVGEEVLTHAVAELRRALGDGADPYIETVYKSGYRLLQPVRPTGGRGGPSDRPSARELTEAFGAYLEAQALAERGGRVNVNDAIRLFREAVAADPAFAPAHAGLAITLVKSRNYYGGGAPTLIEAGAHAEQAIALDCAACEAHTAKGAVLSARGDGEGALASFKSAIQLRPDAAETYRLLGRVFFATGAFRATSAACDRASELRNDELRALLLAAKARRAIGDLPGIGVGEIQRAAKFAADPSQEPD